MRWQKILKTLLVSLALTVVVIAGLLFWGLSKLPSAFDIKQTLTPKAFKKEVAKIEASTGSKGHEETSLEKKNTEPVTEESQKQTEKEKLVEQTSKVLLEDFSDARKPLVETCRYLQQASESQFLRDQKNASAKYFFQNLAEDQKDPLVESAAPIFRYIFRAPGMDQVLDMVMKAQTANDQSLLRKAEFYYEIYRAGEYLQSHQADMDVILQKTYNLHHLAKAVAQKPELSKDPATLSFCEQMEKSVNGREFFDANEASKEMMKFLRETGIDPKTIGFDPHYRSQVKMNLSKAQLTINDSWIVQMFARDIERAQKEPAAKN